MKTIILFSTHSVVKAILLQVAIACFFALQTLSAQSAQLVNGPAATINMEKTDINIGLQSIAFPVNNKQNTIRVIFEDPTGKGAVINIREVDGQIVYRKECFHKKDFMGDFDLSLLPDGSYRVEIVALTKAGFNEKIYLYSFQMQTETKRSIKPWNKEVEKELFTPRIVHLQR